MFAVVAIVVLPSSRLPSSLLRPHCHLPIAAARCSAQPCCCATVEVPWELLGVEPTATDAEIRLAYRRRARQIHPDVCSDPDAPQQFQKLVAAFKMLRTEQSRSRSPQWQRARLRSMVLRDTQHCGRYIVVAIM